MGIMRNMRGVVLILGLLLLAGCLGDKDSGLIAEREEKHFQRAQRKLREGDNERALVGFLKVIDKRKEAPESHLEAGRLYLTDIGDPIEAIHHFRKYLEYKPNSPHVQSVKQLINTAQKDFARQLPGQPFKNDLDRLDLMELLKQTQKENVKLKRDILRARKRIAALQQALSVPTKGSSTVLSTPSFSNPKEAASISQQRRKSNFKNRSLSVPETYTVKAGDTLTRISTRVYGTPSRWRDIYVANRDTMPNENALKIGQVLRIP